jgi:hypothetical protein
MAVNKGGVDDTVNWAFSKADSAGVTSTFAGATVTITSMTVDTGHVDITATRAGFSAQTLRFGLSKTKAGVPAMASGVVNPAPYLQSLAVLNTGCTSGFRFNTDGSLNRQAGSASFVADPNQWYTPITATAGNGYWIRVVPTSGTFTTGTIGSYVPLSTARTFGIFAGPGTTKTTTATYFISANSAGTQVVANGIIELNADAT